MRAIASVVPPAAKGATMVSGLAGHICASAGRAARTGAITPAMLPAAAAKAIEIKHVFMRHLSTAARSLTRAAHDGPIQGHHHAGTRYHLHRWGIESRTSFWQTSRSFDTIAITGRGGCAAALTDGTYDD